MSAVATFNMLVKDFQALASREHMQHKFMTADGKNDRQCHRCMKRFKNQEQLSEHLSEASCLKPTMFLDPPVKKSLPPPTGEGKPPRIGFRNVKAKMQMPLCVYMDYETFWTGIDSPEHAQSGPYTVAVGTSESLHTPTPLQQLTVSMCQKSTA